MKIDVKVFLFLLLSIGGCSQERSFLTDEEKFWNPYIDGMSLVFSSSGGINDTLTIINSNEIGFPDGIGSLKNERLQVVVKRKISNYKRSTELTFLRISAQSTTELSNIDFQFSIPGSEFWGRNYKIADLDNHDLYTIQTPCGIFDDVIVVECNSKRIPIDTDIITIYWSKSNGYIKYERKDGVIGELISIKSM